MFCLSSFPISGIVWQAALFWDKSHNASVVKSGEGDPGEGDSVEMLDSNMSYNVQYGKDGRNGL